MPKKTLAFVAMMAVCLTAVLLTALFRDSLCELHYKGKDNDLQVIFAYEAS